MTAGCAACRCRAWTRASTRPRKCRLTDPRTGGHWSSRTRRASLQCHTSASPPLTWGLLSLLRRRPTRVRRMLECLHLLAARSQKPTSSSTTCHRCRQIHFRSSFLLSIEPKTIKIFQNYSQDQLRELFSSIGDIETCKLCRHRETKMSLGYGFVNFRRPSDAKRAVESFNGLSIQTKSIKVSYARPSSNIIKVRRQLWLTEWTNSFYRTQTCTSLEFPDR